jgi:hypothetical protein
MKAAIATVAAMIHGLNFGFHCCSVGAVAISSSEFATGQLKSVRNCDHNSGSSSGSAGVYYS